MCVFESGELREALAEGETTTCADCECFLLQGLESLRMEQSGFVRACRGSNPDLAKGTCGKPEGDEAAMCSFPTVRCVEPALGKGRD